MQMNILVTGGAGYIGSHTSYLLEQKGLNLIVLDNLYSGHKWAIAKSAKFYEGSFGDQDILERIFTEQKIDAVVHFAAFIEVEESTKDPLKYYRNNTANAITLLEACIKHGVDKFIFSSTAAVYGEPKTVPINESFEKAPINPYGNSKFCTELILKDLAEAERLNGGNFNYIALRYFNVAGACKDGHIGQATPKATHLIKIASEAATGKRDGMKIFGSDYPTSDGTCVRDYIHVDDLAQAHYDALMYLKNGGKTDVFNCGYGHGYSVKEVIETVKKVSEVDFQVAMADRREGDPAELVADSKKAKDILGWTPQFDDLSYICKTAYSWEKDLNNKL